MKLLAALFTSLLMVTSAVAQTGSAKTAAELNTEVAGTLASGQTPAITAAQLRQVFLDLIASSLGPGTGVTAAPNTVLAGPTTGTSSAAATFRALVAADIPGGGGGTVTAAAIKAALGFTPQTIFNIADFGAVGNGTTDDYPAFLAAFTACSVTGGTIMLGPLKYLVSAGDLNIPAYCTLSGAAHWPGNYNGGIDAPASSNYGRAWTRLDYQTQPYTILLNPARTIHFNRNSGLTQLQVSSSTNVVPTTLQAGINLVNGFTGTAVTLGDGGVSTGARVNQVGIWGFNTCIAVNHPNDISEVYGDCLNGINVGSITHVGDEVRWHHIQIFPWMTQNQTWTNFSSNVSGAVNHGDGTIDIGLSTAIGLTPGTSYHVVVLNVAGTIEANGGWTGTVNANGTINLAGSAFANAYTSGGTLALTVNYRAGTAFNVGGGATPSTTGCDGCGFSHVFELGHATAFHFGNGALFAYCYECSFDSPQSGDNTTIGYLIDGNASSISLSGEFQSQKGTGIRVNAADLTDSTGLNSRSHHLNTPRISSASSGSTFTNGQGSYAIEVLKGNLTVMGGYIANAIHVGSGAGQLILDDVDGHSGGNIVIDGSNAGALQLHGGRWPAKVTPDASAENRLVNGDFLVSQPGGNAVLTIGGSTYVIDGWKVRGVGLFASFSHQRIDNSGTPNSATPPTAAPSGDGAAHAFSYRHLVTAPATPGVADFEYFGNRIEGNLVGDLNWGNTTTNPAVLAKSVVVSLWLKSTINGSFSVGLTNNGQTRSYVHNCTLTGTTDQWKYCSFVVPGDTAGTWTVNRNQIGIELTINLGAGSTFQTATADAWQAGNFRALTGSTQLVSNAAARLDVTGVRIRAGTADVPYIPRPFALEFEMARRYYQTSFTLDTAPATNAGLAGAVCATNPAAASFPSVRVPFNPPLMNSNAITVTTYNPSATGANWRIVTGADAGTDATVSVDPATAIGSSGVQITTAGTVATAGGALCIHYSASAAL